MNNGSVARIIQSFLIPQVFLLKADDASKKFLSREKRNTTGLILTFVLILAYLGL